MITKIKIDNVKGYGIPGKEIKLSLSSKKINLCVAPNGFGKSSLAIAFELLSNNRARFDVAGEFKNINHVQEESSLSVEMDGEKYEANNQINEISSALKVQVIRNRVHAEYDQKWSPYGAKVKAFTDIRDIEVTSVEKRASLPAFLTKLKSKFGRNGKILIPLTDLFSDNHFCELLPKLKEIFCKFATKKRSSLVNFIVDELNKLNGNADTIRKSIDDELFNQLANELYYQKFLSMYAPFLRDRSKFEAFSIFYQLRWLWSEERKALMQLARSSSYELLRERLNANLKLLDTTGRRICATETKGKLKVCFPHADEISNGQRDMLTFAVELIIFKSLITQSKKYLLLIDEVFDYLDDANTLAAQYYLSQILQENKENIYIMLLTHLNPHTFRNYVFNPKVINEVYLEDAIPVASNEMMAFIAFRENLKPKQNPSNQALYDKLSRDIFHYNPQAENHTTEITLYQQNNLKTSWGDHFVFKQVLIDELNKYLTGAKLYDPYAVAIAMRLRVEKVMYDALSTQELKDKFINTHTTNAKLEFCEDHQILIPDAYFIMNAIHNSADHLKQNTQTGKFEEKQMVYKLQNGVVKQVISHLFEYNQTPINVSALL